MVRSGRRIVLCAYPRGLPQASDFALDTCEVETPASGEVLVETRYLSMDPALRMRMSPPGAGAPPLQLGETVIGRGVGVVLESADAQFRPGDVVAGDLGWQDYVRIPAAHLRRVDPALGPIQASLGILGPSGIAAWCLVHRAARVQAGDTVLVSAAAGAVGSTAVQLARRAGGRVIALVGGVTQRQFAAAELQAEATVDHTAAELVHEIAQAAPQGINVFLDSIGGELHNVVMKHIAPHARIVAFGFISAYNALDAPVEYGRMYQLIRKRATLSGFLVGDYAAEFPQALGELAAALTRGELRNFESCEAGLEAAPACFARLFSAASVGKQLVKVR